MSNVQKGLVQEGTTFENALFSYPWCCPSRASMLRGQYPHNHGILSNTYPRGGERLFKRRSLDTSTAATWLDAVGYDTVLIGKYLNDYTRPQVPPGWDEWYAQTGENSGYGQLNENGKTVSYQGKHMDGVLKNKALDYVSARSAQGRPFFMWLGFNAPHAPAPYQQVYGDAFQNVRLPRTPNFDERDVSDKPGWVRRKPPVDASRTSKMTELYRDRLRSLQTVDRGVGDILQELERLGELENTYVFFWTDNGFHLGNHRLPAGKQTPYLEDVRVPLIARGPGVTEGAERQQLVMNTDLAPTFADLGVAPIPDFVDGRSMVPLFGSPPTADWREAALVEAEASTQMGNPAFRTVLTERYAYTEYETGERELYDLQADPYQLDNSYGDDAPVSAAALDERLEVLARCSGQGCQAAEDRPIP